LSNVESNIRDSRNSYHYGNRLVRNPFDPVYPVEHLEYCKICKMDVDVTVEAGEIDLVDVYRKRCKRCGEAVQYGIGRRHIDGSSLKPLPPQVLRFVNETGKDRR